MNSFLIQDMFTPGHCNYQQHLQYTGIIARTFKTKTLRLNVFTYLGQSDFQLTPLPRPLVWHHLKKITHYNLLFFSHVQLFKRVFSVLINS